MLNRIKDFRVLLTLTSLLALCASSPAHSASNTSGTDGQRANACTAKQIEGGYEDRDGECVLTGWNWVIGGKCVAGSCGATGCVTAVCEGGTGDGAPGDGGGHGTGGSGEPSPLTPEPGLTDVDRFIGQCEAEGLTLGEAIPGMFLLNCQDAKGEPVLICTIPDDQDYPPGLEFDHLDYSGPLDCHRVDSDNQQADAENPLFHERPAMPNMFPERRVDYCLSDQFDCGLPAADAICEARHGDGFLAADFKRDAPAEQTGPTWKIGASGWAQCDEGCAGFAFVECTNAQQTFHQPRVYNERVDYCEFEGGENCGQPAADRACRMLMGGHATSDFRATSFQVDWNSGYRGRTLRLGEYRVQVDVPIDPNPGPIYTTSGTSGSTNAASAYSSFSGSYFYTPMPTRNPLYCTGPFCDGFSRLTCAPEAAFRTSWPDADDDGVVDSADNCPYVVNPLQEDENGVGSGDACATVCEDDRDNDADGRFDEHDPGCYAASDRSEADAFVPANVRQDGLMGHWAFDGNGIDLSYNGHQIGALDRSDFGSGVFADGSGASSLAPQYGPGRAIGIDDFPTQRGTIAAWVWHDETGSLPILSMGSQASTHSGIRLRIDQDRFQVTFGHGGSSSIDQNALILTARAPNLQRRRWQHVAVTFALGSHSDIRLYVDGVRVPDADVDYQGHDGNLVYTSDRLEIGERGVAGRGGIDEAYLYHDALAPFEIQEVYASVANQGLIRPVPEPGTVLLLGAGILGLVVIVRRRAAEGRKQ